MVACFQVERLGRELRMTVSTMHLADVKIFFRHSSCTAFVVCALESCNLRHVTMIFLCIHKVGGAMWLGSSYVLPSPCRGVMCFDDKCDTHSNPSYPDTHRQTNKHRDSWSGGGDRSGDIMVLSRFRCPNSIRRRRAFRG